jgi:erythronate-4-phosphate dehydrogenase
MKELKILCDNTIENIEEIFSNNRVEMFSPSDFSDTLVNKSDILIIGSQCKVKSKFNLGSIKCIATPITGTDHIDNSIKNSDNISFFHSPGFNAQAVVDYVLSAIYNSNKYQDLSESTLGIIGFGNIGKLLSKSIQKHVRKILIADPFVSHADKDNIYFTDLQTLLSDSDIVSVHANLHQGEHPTLNMFDDKNFALLKKDSLFINAARGNIVSEDALNNFLQKNKTNEFVLDVWPQEPNVNPKLCQMVDIATPHIAGYSEFAKFGALLNVCQKISDKFGIKISKTKEGLQMKKKAQNASLLQSADSVVKIKQISTNFKSFVKAESNNIAKDFVLYRKEYKLRAQLFIETV